VHNSVVMARRRVVNGLSFAILLVAHAQAQFINRREVLNVECRVSSKGWEQPVSPSARARRRYEDPAIDYGGRLGRERIPHSTNGARSE